MSPALRAGVALFAAAFSAHLAYAGQFNLSPTRINLSAQRTSALIAIENTGTETLRFHATVWGWSQTADSDIELTATDEVLVYPSLIEVAPGESRSIRVGTTAEAGATERAWRLLVEELPPAPGAEPVASGRTTIRVLTRASVPVFLAPPHPTAHLVVSGLAMADGEVSVELANDGNAHMMLQSVHIVGRDAEGHSVYDDHEAGWYVLPGVQRVTTMDVPEASCRLTKTLSVDVNTDAGIWHDTLPVGPGSCPSGAP